MQNPNPPPSSNGVHLSMRHVQRKMEDISISPRNLASHQDPSFPDASVLNKPPLPVYVGENEEETDRYLLEYLPPQLSDVLSFEEEEQLHHPIVHIPREHLWDLWKPWRKAIIVKMLGKTVGYKRMKQRLQDLWKLRSGVVLTDLEDSYFVVRFRCEEDYNHVIFEGPWILMGHYLSIRPWRPWFSPSRDVISTAVVCVTLPQLPVEYLNEEVLLYIGSTAFGKAVKVDRQSLDMESGRTAARVCIEMELDMPFEPYMLLNGFKQAVEYQGLDIICFRCGRYGGHRLNRCDQIIKKKQLGPIARPLNGSRVVAEGSSTSDGGGPLESEELRPSVVQVELLAIV